MLASVSCDSTSAPPAANQSIDGTESDENQTCVTTGCDDGNACTVDRCEVFAGNYACRHIPQECEPGRTCDPDSGACVECFSGSDCSDGQFCNGEETCDAGTCGLGISPCGKSACDEVVDECAFCLLDADCDDEVFCNGVELCSNGVCEAGEAPCAGTCDEELDSCGDEFAARIVGCLPSSVYFDVDVPLTAQVDGGFGERNNIEWIIEAEHATLTSTRSPSTSLLIPEEEDIVVKLIATDDAQVEGEWITVSKSTAECVIPATLPKTFFKEAPISGTLPESFDKNGGNFELSVSPVDKNGDLITTGLETRSFDFVDVVITPLNSPGVVVTTGQVTSNNLSVIEPQDPDEPARGVTVTISLDETGSMLSNDPRRLRVEAAQTLVRRLDEGDSAAVLAFALNGSPFSPGMLGSRLLQDFTHDHGLLNRAIESIDAFGSTPLFDAIFDAVSLLDRSHRHNPAAVVLTDGLENASTFATFDSVIELAVRTEIPIFPIGLGTNINFNQLQELARLTGGTFASALNPEALNALFHALGTAVTAGRAIVSARVSFAQPITTPGIYTVSGNLEITIEEQTRTSPFSFQVTIGNPPLARVQRPETELGAPIAIP